MDKEGHYPSTASSNRPRFPPAALAATFQVPATAGESEWPLCSSSSTTTTTTTSSIVSYRLGDTKRSLGSPTTRQAPIPHQQQQRWTHSLQQNYTSSVVKKPELNSFFNRVKEGQRVRRPFQNGAEFDLVYADSPLDPLPPHNFHSTMVQKKTLGPSDTMNGSGKRQSAMPYTRGGMNKAQNGSRASFQTDVSISGGRLGDRRELQPWTAGGSSSNGLGDGGLEDSSDSKKPWDQFAVNEEKFGVRTDYDENLYTTAIDRSRPDYNDKLARAEKLARKIEGSAPVSAHTAEERVMDHVAGPHDGQDEEDKYSGVKRADFPPLTGSASNVYTPPARRAPTGQATVKGAPVDPAIISSQLRAPASEKATAKPEEASSIVPETPAKVQPTDSSKAVEPSSKNVVKTAESAEKSQSDPKKQENIANLRAQLTAQRNVLPATKGQPIENQVHKAFKDFAQKERMGVREKAEDAKKKKLKELMSFASSFKLGTPVPHDLIGIIAKDPKKQAEIQEKAKKNAEEVQRSKEAVAKKTDTAGKEAAPAAAKPALTATKSSEPAALPTTTGTTTSAQDTRGAGRGAGIPTHANAAGTGPNRHPGGNRQSYGPGQYQQPYRGDRVPGQNLPRHNQQGGHMGQLRSGEHQRMAQAPLRMNPDMRMPPTGPANSMGPPPSFAPRHAGMSSMGPPRLNPSTVEFIPSGQHFIPTGPSSGSSPRSTLNNVTPATSTPVGVLQPVAPKFRKIRVIDVKMCNILSGVQSVKPDPAKKSVWDDNGLRPPYETQITWKTVLTPEEGKISWKEQFERPPIPSIMATPTSLPAMPQMPHQHQLPFHLQQGAQNAGPRQSPHIPPIPMHGGHPGHPPHMPFNNGDDGTRMMHSNSSQSYASPRPGQVNPMAYPPNMMSSPSAMQYSQPVMQGYMGPPAPQMTPQMRYPQNPQYMGQHGQMGPPMMMPQGFMPGPGQMMQGSPQMQMGYGNTHPNFVPPGAGPPQAMQGVNGYPSPGRPVAPMMAHQGSQQGPAYGMSPGGMPFQQPHYQQQPGQMGNMRVNSNPGPQQGPQYGLHQNRGNGYGGKNFAGPHQGPSPPHNGPGIPQARASESQEEAK